MHARARLCARCSEQRTGRAGATQKYRDKSRCVSWLASSAFRIDRRRLLFISRKFRPHIYSSRSSYGRENETRFDGQTTTPVAIFLSIFTLRGIRHIISLLRWQFYRNFHFKNVKKSLLEIKLLVKYVKFKFYVINALICYKVIAWMISFQRSVAMVSKFVP